MPINPNPASNAANPFFMLFATLLAIVIGICTFLNSPGMFVIGTYKMLFMPMMSLGQAWTFSLIVSGIWAWFLWLGNHKNWWIKYIASCAVILAVGLVVHFGFLAEYPLTVTKAFFTSASKATKAEVPVKAETVPVPEKVRHRYPDPRSFAPIIEEAPALKEAPPVSNLTPRN